MAANGRGYMRPSSAGRTPPFLIIGLLIVISILAFNYWSLSSKNNALTREIDEAEMKYRSVQVRKLDVEKRNAELSALLDEAKKYKQEAQEKDMRLREAEQKEKELNSKLDNLAGEAEVLKNDLNTCDDEVGFCHENITKMIITHKKALEEAQMNCNMKVDEARSSAEQRAASVENSCQQAVNEMRLTILRMVQQVFGTKAIILLHEQAHADVSGIDLTKMTGLDVQQSQLVQTQPVLQQGQQQQQPLNEQQQQQQEQKQMLQEQQQQQPLQEQTHLEQQQSPQEQQQQQQPQQSFQEQQQPQLQQVPQEQQPQLQQLPQEQLQQKIPQEQPQLQEHLKEQLPKDQLQQPEQQVEGALQQLQQQQQLPNVVEQNKEEHLEQKQVSEAKNDNNRTEKVKEPIVLQGLSQTSDLARAVQEGYKNMPLEVQQQMATVQQQQQSQQPQQQLQQISAAQSVLEQKPENLQPYVQQEAKPVLPGDDLQDHHMTGLERHDPDVQPVPNEVVPAGHASVQDSIDGAQEKELEVTKDRVLDLDQRRDQAAYLANDAAPVGQAVGAEIVVAAQQSLSPLSIQVLNEHYQLPEELDSNLRSELSKAEHDLKTQLAFSEEKLHIGSLKELLKSASQQSVINLRRFPADGHFPETNTKVTDIDTNHSTAHLSNIHSSNDANNLHGVSSLSANLVGKNSLPNVFDKNAPSNRDQVEHNIDEQEFGSISMIEDSDNDHYEKAVSKILSKESLLDLPELDSMLYKDNTDGRLMEEEDAIQKEQVESAGPKKTFSHGFLYLNLSQLLESSDLDDDFMDESNGRREGDSVDDDDEDLFLDGTTNHYEATTENGYSTEAHDWAETTKPSMDFDAVNIPLDRFDNQEEAPGRVGEGENVSGQHLISGQLPKAVDTHQHYNTLEDQLRLPVNDNGQDKPDEVVPQFHEYAEAGREQINELQQNDKDIEQIPQQGPLI